MDKQKCGTTEQLSAIKRIEPFLHKTWINLKIIMMTESSQNKK